MDNIERITALQEEIKEIQEEFGPHSRLLLPKLEELSQRVYYEEVKLYQDVVKHIAKK